jgi:mycofactocin glycosyltransferase
VTADLMKAVDVLPPTTRIEPEPGLQVLDGRNGNTVLLGGSPYKLLTLRPAAAAVVTQLLGGKTIGQAATQCNVSTAAAERIARRLLDNGMAEPAHQQPNQYSVADVTAVIPVKNEAESIGQLIHELTKSGIAHIVVVDDGSTDNTHAAAVAAGADVVRHDRSLGPGQARMSAMPKVTTALVLFIDADAAPPSDWSLLIAAFDDPDVTIAAPRVASLPGTDVVSRYETTRSSLDLGIRRASVRPRSRVSYVPSAVLLVQVDALMTLDGFDPGLRYGEDVDLVWRAAGSGQVVRYEADVVAHHRPRPSLQAFVRQRMSYGSAAAPLDQRHQGLVAPLQASGWSVAVWALAVLGGPLGLVAALGTAVGTASALERKLLAIAQPRRVAWSLALRGHLGVGRQLASATWRAWLPFAMLAAVFSQRVRHALLLSAAMPIEEWLQKRPRLDPVRFTALRLLDDASYCAGVWQGCLTERTFRALLPHLANWPGKVPPAGPGSTSEAE